MANVALGVLHRRDDGVQVVSLDDLRFMWEQFEDISINDADEIDEEYMGWPAGTDRFDIWHWFDVHWPKGVYNLVYEGGDLSC